MRHTLAALAALAAAASTAEAATTVPTARLIIAVAEFENGLLLPAVQLADEPIAILGDGSVRFSETFRDQTLLGDGSVSVAVQGDVDPFLDLTFTFTDAGAPTVLTASIISPLLPTLTGTAAYSLSGSLRFPLRSQSSTSGQLPGGDVLSGAVGPDLSTLATLVTIGGGPFSGPGTDPNDLSLGTAAGSIDCAGVPGNCAAFGLYMGFSGLGGGQQLTVNGRFEIEGAVAPVPLPAPFALLAAGLALLGVAARRR